MNSLFQYIPPNRRKQIRSIHIKFDDETIIIYLRFFNDPVMKFSYQKVRSFSLRDLQRIHDRKVYIVDENFVSLFCEDLNSLITQQNCVLDEIGILSNGTIYSAELFSTLRSALEFRSHEIQLRKIKCSDTQILSILPFLDAKALASVVVYSENPMKNMTEFLTSEVWKSMEGLEIQIRVDDLSWRHLVFLKQSLLFSRIFSSINITFVSLQENYLFKHFGHFEQSKTVEGLMESYIHVWHTKRDYLKVSLNKESNQIIFSRVKCDNDPNGFTVFDNHLEAVLLEEIDIESEHLGSLGLEVLANNVIMVCMAAHLNFVDFEVLRKTTRSVRNCIDQLKPDPQIKSIYIAVHSAQKTNVAMNFNNRESLKISYEGTEHGCLVNEHFVNQNLHERLFQDLQINLKHQTSELKELRIDFHPERAIETNPPTLRFLHIIEMTTPFFENFANAFSKNSLRIQKLNTVFINKCFTLGVLAKLEPKTLKSIELRTPLQSGALVLVPTSSLTYTEQWKHTKEVMMKECLNIFPLEIKQFAHLAKVELVQAKMSDYELFTIKEVSSPRLPALVKFKIGFRSCSISTDIYNLFGQPYRMADDELAQKRDTWYFFMPLRNRALHIVYYKSQCVIFSCVSLDAVPEDAVLVYPTDH